MDPKEYTSAYEAYQSVRRLLDRAEEGTLDPEGEALLASSMDGLPPPDQIQAEYLNLMRRYTGHLRRRLAAQPAPPEADRLPGPETPPAPPPAEATCPSSAPCIIGAFLKGLGAAIVLLPLLFFFAWGIASLLHHLTQFLGILPAILTYLAGCTAGGLLLFSRAEEVAASLTRLADRLAAYLKNCEELKQAEKEEHDEIFGTRD